MKLNYFKALPNNNLYSNFCMYFCKRLACLGKPLPVMIQSLVQQSVIRCIEQAGKRSPKRWSDTPGEMVLLWRRYAKPIERISDTAGDTLFGIGQGSIQVKEYVGEHFNHLRPKKSAHRVNCESSGTRLPPSLLRPCC